MDFRRHGISCRPVKYLTLAAGILVGLLFIAAGVTYLFNLAAPPPPPEGSPVASFFAAFAPTGYLGFVKVLEVLGGVLLALPWTRRLGLLILGPIVINILAFQVFLTGGEGLKDPVIVVMTALMLFLTWSERAAFAAFLRPTAR